MLDIKFIRENPAKVKEGARLKGFKVDIDRLLAVDGKRVKILQEIEKIRAEKNRLSEEVAKSSGKDKTLLTQSRELDAKEQALKPKLEELEQEFNSLMEFVPNLPLPGVPVGKDESENKVMKKWGEPRKFDFEAKDHVALGEALDLIDIERAAKVSGSRFYYLKNEAVLLEFALIGFVTDKLIKKGFTPMWTPLLVKEDIMWGGGFLPFGKEEIYRIEKDDLYLIGTSEQTLISYHKDEILDEKELPKKYAGFSACHREEAGSYGKDTRGILRVHHFDKVEMVVYAKPEDSEKIHQELLANEEGIMQDLEIPYQVVLMCTGDLGAPAAKKYDIEAWIPSQGKYRETHSTSNCTDFQARRLKVRYRKPDGSIDFVHILNGTAVAIGRTLIAILENYQQKDGSVRVPRVLAPYLGLSEIRRKEFGKQ